MLRFIALLDQLEDVTIMDFQDLSNIRYVGSLYELLKRVGDLTEPLQDLIKMIKTPKNKKFAAKMLNAILEMKKKMGE
jgi:hypothetical protein